MSKPTNALLALAALAVPFTLLAQQPAPIEHAYAPPSPIAAALTTTQPLVAHQGVITSQPSPGVYLRLAPHSSIAAVSLSSSTNDATTELRLDRGLANISIHHPDHGTVILVDLPGGQVSLIKDGFYTFNATTNTVRVLKGEALTSLSSRKPLKMKEDHAVVLTGPNPTSAEFEPEQAAADVIPYRPQPDGPQYARGGYGRFGGYPGYYGYYGGYGDGFYGDGYGYPYGYGYGDPYGYYGYPFGIGLGFGYYGGGGGFRGGYGGFHGGGFHGGGHR